MSEPQVASFSLTHVNYNPSDRISYISAWLALLPQALCVTYVSLIWATREVEILLMFAGQMGCELLNFILKRWIKEERPQKLHGRGYGMPSSHAQFMTYFSISLTLFLLFRHKPLPNSTAWSASLTNRAAFAAAVILVAASVASSRIYLKYHTPKQVFVGIAAGVACAVGWFLVTAVARQQGWLDWALDLDLLRWVRLRDLVVTEDLTDAGWSRWESIRAERRALTNKATPKRTVKAKKHA